jgi:O-antigen/teichoic acid export membrane protein
MILTSLLASKSQTGLFATSFQVFAVLFALPLLVLSSALPLLSVAGRDDDERLRFGLQKMTEVAFAVSLVIVLVIVVLAPTLVPLLGGSEYRGAAPVLQIQAFALVAVFLGQVGQLALLSLRRQSALAWANGGALLVVLVLGGIVIPFWDARGAAGVAVVGETVLAVVVFGFLHRVAPQVMPTLGLLPRIAAAAVLAFAVLFLPVPWEAQLPLSLAVFGAAAYALRAIPFELIDALRGR